jgi:hypothetical protein
MRSLGRVLPRKHFRHLGLPLTAEGSHAIFSRMTESGFSAGTPQFGTAEYQSGPVENVCKMCSQPISGTYYRANTATLCGSCAEHLQRQIPQDSHAAFVRGIIFGLVGFVLGLILYAGFVIATGIEIGFVSLPVGWLVGKAVMMGSGGVGGKRYQIAAVLLTYAAVSMAFIPIVIHYARTHKLQQTQTQQEAQQPGTASPNNQAGEPQQTPSHSPAGATRPKPNMAAALGKLAILGLVSPFLQLQGGISGVIGLFILFIGMQFAWRITRGVRLAIDGPFQSSSRAKA